jgi:hypothetical protein
MTRFATLRSTPRQPSKTVHRILAENLHFRKLCARWVPKNLTPEHKTKRIGSALFFLERYENGDQFLTQIVTGDERGYAMSPQKESYSPCSGVTHHTHPKKIQAESQRSLNHVHGILGPLWSFPPDYRPNVQTINSKVYCDNLQRLSRAIQNKRRGLLSSSVVLLHNARPHTAR